MKKPHNGHSRGSDRNQRRAPSHPKPKSDPALEAPRPPLDPARPQDKDGALEGFRDRFQGATRLSTDQAIPIENTDDSLKVGARGPTLLEDFHFREKLTRFDHERIPERVVHARGTGAHGFFQVYESLEDLTRADFLCDPDARTPVFVRFSTVVGSRGSTDTPRDVRGFATKFYTREGNFDLVGNNMPVFFIQDGIKFPDLVHAVKPEPHNEIPQAASAHDTFWDFVSLTPETLHMVLWVMSDRALPRSLRMMEGFGVHTFRLVNEQGGSVLVKFHWKPLLGAHSLLWEECQLISGKDPDFHRRDLFEAIELGLYPEYELGLQVIAEEDQLAYGFDLLDPTKLVPEELVPVRRVGKLTLDRNPSNFFAEVEQAAFCIGNVVPGIDFTDDPLLQARLFSYLDTQLLRLGGPNFAEIPINRPLAGVHNHQQDGFHRTSIHTSRALYHPNSIAGGQPGLAAGGFRHFPEALTGAKVRERSDSFRDHYGQARMFLHSQSDAEREHLIQACQFELGKVERLAIRERVTAHFREIEPEFGEQVARAVGVTLAGVPTPVPADGRIPKKGRKPVESSPALSLENQPKTSIRTRKIAVLIADGVRASDVDLAQAVLCGQGALIELVGISLGQVRADDGRPFDVDKSFLTTASVLYDAVYVPGGESASILSELPDAVHFVHEAYLHAKAIGASNEGVEMLTAAGLPGPARGRGAQRGESAELGVVTSRAKDLSSFFGAFVEAVRQHRHFARQFQHKPPREARSATVRPLRGAMP